MIETFFCFFAPVFMNWTMICGAEMDKHGHALVTVHTKCNKWLLINQTSSFREQDCRSYLFYEENLVLCVHIYCEVLPAGSSSYFITNIVGLRQSPCIGERYMQIYNVGGFVDYPMR